MKLEMKIGPNRASRLLFRTGEMLLKGNAQLYCSFEQFLHELPMPISGKVRRSTTYQPASQVDKKCPGTQIPQNFALNRKELEVLIECLQNLYASVRFRPAPP
jgi:hypothetical protein